MKKQLLLSALLILSANAPAAITNVWNNVVIQGTATAAATTNTAPIQIAGVSLPQTQIIVQNSQFNANATNLSAAFVTYLQASLDGTNYITIATNAPTATNALTSAYSPTLPSPPLYYRVSIVATNTITNTVYFGP